MNKKPLRIIAAIEIVLATAFYFALSREFDSNETIMNFLAGTDAASTLLRLAIYVIPGIHLVCGAFGLTFFTKGILLLIGIIAFATALATYRFTGAFNVLHGLSMASLASSGLFVLLSLLMKKE